MKLSPEVNQMLIFESIINDVTIITAVTILIQAVNLNLNPSETLFSIIRNISISASIGAILSISWTLVLVRIQDDLALKYLTTLAIAILLHAFADSQGGSGIISVMIFGVTLGNLPKFFRTSLRIRRNVLRFFTQIEIMQDEITFLVKNTFFFIMGLMFDVSKVSAITLLISIALTFLMIVSRWTSYKILGLIDKRYLENTIIVSLMVSRGLTAGITAFMPLEQGVTIHPIKDIVIIMILLTNISATIGFIARN
jgi:NhaP-type Na+/H+ or K+/H+ antiporter